ncbi:hypothetical protein VPH35_029443 [Triticum aestivum]
MRSLVDGVGGNGNMHGTRSSITWAQPPHRHSRMVCPPAWNAPSRRTEGMPQSTPAAMCTTRPRSSPASTEPLRTGGTLPPSEPATLTRMRARPWWPAHRIGGSCPR